MFPWRSTPPILPRFTGVLWRGRESRAWEPLFLFVLNLRIRLFLKHLRVKLENLDLKKLIYESDLSPCTEHRNDLFFFFSFLYHRELASHRSGLQREAPCFPDTKENFCPYTNDQMIQRIKNLTLLREPGTEPQYRFESIVASRSPCPP